MNCNSVKKTLFEKIANKNLNKFQCRISKKKWVQKSFSHFFGYFFVSDVLEHQIKLKIDQPLSAQIKT